MGPKYTRLGCKYAINISRVLGCCMLVPCGCGRAPSVVRVFVTLYYFRVYDLLQSASYKRGIHDPNISILKPAPHYKTLGRVGT